MKNNETFVFTTHAVRELPDPEKSIRHYILLCKAAKMPRRLPLDINPRAQNINLSVYKDVRESLISASPTFHLKNKGITMIADRVRRFEKKANVEVQFLKKGQGIVDGGHTYQVIQSVLDSEDEQIPDEQFVKVEILTNVPDEYAVEIAGGLNTSIQVADMSLENLKGNFDWIKDDLSGENYEDRIAYRENVSPDDFGPPISIREVVAWLTMFLPNEHGHPKKENPKMAYGRKGDCLKAFQGELDRYMEMQPILRDILQLHDYILYHALEKYNESTGGRGKALSFMQQRKRGYHLHFMNENISVRMHDGALYPIFGAFRYLVEKRNGKIGWKPGDFRKVKEFCDVILGEMVEITKKNSVERGRNMDAIGKDDLHWGFLYNTFALKWLDWIQDTK